MIDLDANVPDRPIEEKWDQPQFDMKLVNAAQPAQFEVIVVGTGLAGGVGRRDARRARLQRKVVHVPRLAPAGAHDRRAGRHQRGQELQNDGDSDLPPLLRHDEGRRLPLPRGERLPARGDLGRHHRPVRRPGRAVRPRVRRPARQPLVRRRAGVAHVLRPGPDRPAAPARRLPGARPADRAGNVKMYTAPEMLDLVVKDGRGQRHRRPRPVTGEITTHSAPRRRARHRRLRQRLLPVDERQGLQRDGASGGRTDGARCSRTRASRRSTRRASRRATSSSRSSR